MFMFQLSPSQGCTIELKLTAIIWTEIMRFYCFTLHFHILLEVAMTLRIDSTIIRT
jgi:hypothetical protein